MKQQNNLYRIFIWLVMSITALSLILIPLKKYILPRVNHTFYFDNRRKSLPIKRLAVVGDFSEWKERIYLYDQDHDGIWQVTVPLKIGWHSYRFLINGTRWVRDWSVDDYGGPYSNSLIYADTITIPKLYKTIPPTGSWLYRRVNSLRFRFGSNIKNWLKNHKVIIELDSLKKSYLSEDSTLCVPLATLGEGEHDWQISLRKEDGTEVFKRSGLFFLNLRDKAPIARAGHTQVVFTGQRVVLNGGQSFDPDFEPLTAIKWEQISGPITVRLEKKTKAQAFAVFERPGKYRFRLTVWDSTGLTDSDQTEVVVLAQKRNTYAFSLSPEKFSFPVKKVALAGEFNRWQADKARLHFDRHSGKWKISIPLDAGKWEYKFVINDTLWMPDPANPHRISDGWNGYNSLRVIPRDSLFSGKFFQEEESKQKLIVAFSSETKNLKFHWVGDIQNPVKAVPVKNNRLIFNKEFPRGVYYFYLIPEKNGHFGKPKTLLVNHGRQTTWHPFEQTPAWADTTIIYELFLRRFTRAGTFTSLEHRLSYLKKLGVNSIWMLPIYQGPTEHGYAPTSLFKTEKSYGSLADYRHLIQKAHAMGMHVLFDFVANHVSDQHRFVRAAYQNRHSPLRQWFYWRPDGTWGYHNDWDTLVNLNYHNPWVRHYIMSVAQFWLGVGVDGFRCDVAWAVPHTFWKNFRFALKAMNFDVLLLDEVLPRQPSFHDKEFDMSYDTDFYGNILDVLHGRKPISAIPLGIEKSRANYPEGAQSLRYLENHDLPRFIEQFGARLTRMMAVVLLTVPGTPLIYYGQEHGVREMRPYFYDLHDTKWFDFYQKLIKFRKENKALTLGSLQNILIDDENGLWWYRRQWKEQSVDVIINLSERAQTVKTVPEGKIKKIWGCEFKRIGKRTIKIAGKSFIVIQRDEGK